MLIEDDVDLCRSIQNELVENGYLTDCCHDGETAMLYALNPDFGYDLAIIDRMLPIIDGLTILKAMRRKGIQIPVIIITGMSALDDRVEGLDGGADDYMVKPFHLRELMARVRALTRRPQTLRTREALSFGDLIFQPQSRELRCQDKSLNLTAREAELISALLGQPETVFSREQLVMKVWGSDSEVEPGNVDNYISFLRKRLRQLKSSCTIRTIYGAGYRLEDTHA